MKIYLKGYYWYKNFGDELLLFGIIEEIFSRYTVEKLVIEVGDTDRIKERVSKNTSFLKIFITQGESSLTGGKYIILTQKNISKTNNFGLVNFYQKNEILIFILS